MGDIVGDYGGLSVIMGDYEMGWVIMGYCG